MNWKCFFWHDWETIETYAMGYPPINKICLRCKKRTNALDRYRKKLSNEKQRYEKAQELWEKK